MMSSAAYKTFLLVLALLAGQVVWADDFFDVRGYSCQRASGSIEYEAKVDFPLMGPVPVLLQARQWLCEVLEIDAPKGATTSNFPQLLDEAASRYLREGAGHRKVEITWAYEDPDCVTFLSTITDHDSVDWVTEDCATFRKSDGHRISTSDVFACSEQQIKNLMWQFRGDLPMEVSSADQLYVGSVGFIDGWVVVIGPAAHHTGAAYRIRYQVAEPYLRQSSAGYLSR